MNEFKVMNGYGGHCGHYMTHPDEYGERPGAGTPKAPALRAGAFGARVSRSGIGAGPDQMRPRPRTASRSSSSSFTEASMRARENSLISRPWTISYFPPEQVTGKEEIRPSGTP